MRRGVALLSVALALAVVPAIAGCTVPSNGKVGLTVDGDGNLVAALAWCDDHPPDGMTIYHGSRADAVDVATYEAPELSGRSVRVRLDSPPAGWTARPGPPALEVGIEYNVYGWTEDSSTSLDGMGFRLSELVGLSPDKILVERYVKSSDDVVNVPVSEAAFRAIADEQCG
jgi:hypothetical protein